MKLNFTLKAADIAEILGVACIGSPDTEVNGLNEIHKVTAGDVTFVDYHKYYDRAVASPATLILINAEIPCPKGKALIVTEDPFRDYNTLVRHFYPVEVKPAGQYYQSPESVVGEGTVIRNGAFIDDHVRIGRNCVIHPNVVIYGGSIIGDNVIIHANSTIGADAFYYKKRSNGYDKLLSCGRVIIEDYVEIGANCTIDKGVSGDTILGEGTKLDNHVHVGHGAETGKNCLFAAQVGIGGKTIIEDDVTLWGQVGVQKDIRIGRGAVVLAQSGVSKSIKGSRVYFGSPAGDAKKHYKELSSLRMLPMLLEKLNFRPTEDE